MAKILVVDDEPGIRGFLADALTEAGHDVVEACDGLEALNRLAARPHDLMLVDLRMPGELTGMDVVRRARAEWPALQMLVLTAHGSVETAVEAMRLGAFDFLQKPVASPAALRALVERALSWGNTRHGGRVATSQPFEPAEPSQPGPILSFLWQLKRRHVYNVTATYAAVSFILLQLAELVLPAMPTLPAGAYTVFVVLLLAGFPVAAVLGWAYDITANGLKRTRA